MANFRSKKQNSKRKFSLTIENILKECHDLQNPKFSSMSKYMENQISNLSGIYDQLKDTDLNPAKFEASYAYKNGKRRLSAYIKSKYQEKDRMDKDKLKKILHADDSPRQTQNKLSFNSFRNDEVSGLVMKNKRGFAEGWKYGGFSNKVSPQHSGFPSLSNSPQYSPVNSPHGDKGNLNKLITSMIDKQLGILPKKKEILIKKKTNKMNKKRNIPINLLPIAGVDFENYREDKYLNPEYLLYKSNMGNKLKIQKLIVEKVNRDRRESVRELRSTDALLSSI